MLTNSGAKLRGERGLRSSGPIWARLRFAGILYVRTEKSFEAAEGHKHKAVGRIRRDDARQPTGRQFRVSDEVAPEVGLEPTTNRLTADRSTTELLRNEQERVTIRIQ